MSILERAVTRGEIRYGARASLALCLGNRTSLVVVAVELVSELVLYHPFKFVISFFRSATFPFVVLLFLFFRSSTFPIVVCAKLMRLNVHTCVFNSAFSVLFGYYFPGAFLAAPLVPPCCFALNGMRGGWVGSV